MDLYESSRTLVVAEAGINHNGDVRTAERLIVAAKKAGADAIKFQTYTTERRVPAGSPIFDVLKRAELSYRQQESLKRCADAEGIVFFSTPFDEEAVAFLASLRVALMKVASFRIVDSKLVRAVAATRIQTIVSCGMATLSEVDATVKLFKNYGTHLALLHCVSAYPTPKGKTNLRVVRTLSRLYPSLLVGYSDHTMDIDACLYAVAMEARIIEKHFTLDRSTPGGDHALSADPSMMAELVVRIRELETMRGDGNLGMQDVEKPASILRKVT